MSSIFISRNLRHTAEFYGSQLSWCAVEEYRKLSGLQSISSTCFEAARISTILIDDGIEFDKKHDIEWHKSFAQVVGRILRIERLAEKILDELHAEAGRGQFEVALGHTACNYAADNLVFTPEVIRAVARKRGLLATFLPKYALDDIGSGSHVHLSLYQNGENVFMATGGTSRYGMSTVGQEFMAGFLHHLPAILAFTAPLPNS